MATLPPHDALGRIWQAADLPARFVAAAPPQRREAVRANLQALLHAALDLAGGRMLTPYALVRALRTATGGPRAPVREWPGAIRLLTIHGAKGLQAPLVLWLDTDAAEARADLMPVLVDWPGQSPAPRRLVFLRTEKAPPPCCAGAVAADRAERAREEVNGLYVAMTRAQTELVLSAHAPRNPSAGSPWSRLAPYVPAWVHGGDEIGAHSAATPAPSDPLVWDLPVLAEARLTGPVAPPMPDDALPDDRAARVGQAMHRLLQWGCAATGWTDGQLRAVRREFRLDGDAVAQAARMAWCIATGAGAWAWDAAQLAWQGSEVPLTAGGRVLRADRVVQRRDGNWWVLDYKSATAPQDRPQMREQLLRYREALQAGLPAGTVVRCAFLTSEGALVEVTSTQDPPSGG